MLERVTAGEALYRVVRTLTDRRPLDDLLAEILAQTRAMLDATETYLLLTDDDQLIVRAAEGLRLGPKGRRQFGIDEGIEGLAARSGEPIVASALQQDARFVDPFDRPRPVGSMLAVPLVLHGHLLGVLVSTRQQPGRFAGVETWWLDVFGGLVATLISTDHAYHLQERRAIQAETLLALGATEDVAPISPPVLAEIARGFGTDHCGFLMLDPSRRVFQHTAYDREHADGARESELPVDDAGPLRDVALRRRTLTRLDVPPDRVLRRLPFLRDVRSLLAAPIAVGGETRGLLYVGTGAPTWPDGDEAFLELVATRIGLQLERSELREREREVERQQALMSARQEFLEIVSHELKTPVAVMKAYAELLFRRAERAGRAEEMDIIRRMTDQTERMLGMIEQLLDLRRLEAGLLTLEISHFDLADVVRRLAHDVELTTTAHRFVVDARRAMVRADRRRIEQVVTNLLDNAVKYSPRGGTIRVWVAPEPDGKSVLLSVTDEGPGVAAVDRDRIFERFYQGQGRLHKGRAGLGLGLYVSRELVHRHGGEIWLASEPGHGATFSVRLPVEGPPTPE